MRYPTSKVHSGRGSLGRSVGVQAWTYRASGVATWGAFRHTWHGAWTYRNTRRTSTYYVSVPLTHCHGVCPRTPSGGWLRDGSSKGHSMGWIGRRHHVISQAHCLCSVGIRHTQSGCSSQWVPLDHLQVGTPPCTCSMSVPF